MRPTSTLCIPVFLKNVVFKPAKQKSDFFTPFNPTRKKSLKDVSLIHLNLEYQVNLFNYKRVNSK